MTYEEAKMQIQAIPEKIWDQLSEPDREAMEMAFSALQAQANESKTRNFLFTESGNESKERDIILRQDAIDLVEGLESARLKGEIDLLYPKVVKGLNRLPSAQPERKKGKWHHCEGMYTCDQCGSSLDDISQFCPMCGADMREERRTDGKN